MFSVEPAPQVGVEVANPRRVPRESGGETRREEECGEALDTARKLHARTQRSDGARRIRTRRENGEINETGRSRRELVIGRERQRETDGE